MISLQSHDRLGRSSARPDVLASLPDIEERAAIARRWEASAAAPSGVRRGIRREAPRHVRQMRHEERVSMAVAPVVDALSLGDGDDLAGLRAFAARMLS